MDVLSCQKLKHSLHLSFLNQFCQPFSPTVGPHQLSLMTGGEPTSGSEESQLTPTQPAQGHTWTASGPAGQTTQAPSSSTSLTSSLPGVTPTYQHSSTCCIRVPHLSLLSPASQARLQPMSCSAQRRADLPIGARGPARPHPDPGSLQRDG